MTLEDLRVFINATANRDQTGNSVSPKEYNSYLKRANEDKFRIETGLREKPTPIFFQSNQLSTDALRPFIEEAPLVGVSGVFTIPSDYRHAVSLSYVKSGETKIITALNTDEFKAKKMDKTAPPTVDYPFATQRKDKIILAPDSIANISLDYLRKPVDPLWAYTVSNDEEVYDSANSVQLEWADIYHIDIARIICSYMGIQFRDIDFYQYSEKVKTEGA